MTDIKFIEHDGTARFELGDGNYVDVCLTADGSLMVRGFDGRLKVIPSCSNVLYVELEPRS